MTLVFDVNWEKSLVEVESSAVEALWKPNIRRKLYFAQKFSGYGLNGNILIWAADKNTNYGRGSGTYKSEASRFDGMDYFSTQLMNEEYLRFKLFPDKQTAEEFSEILKQNSIEYKIEEDALVFDPSYANNPLSKDYVIMLKQSDFKAASHAYDEYFAEQLNNVPEDYYLFAFTNDELQEILARPDEWGSFDYQLAQDLLKQRGIEVTKERTDRLKAERYVQLAQPETEPIKNIVGYYIISFLFYPIGIIIGWVWGYSKKQLPDGYKVYAYNDRVREHGRIIFLISMILFGLTVILRIAGVRLY